MTKKCKLIPLLLCAALGALPACTATLGQRGVPEAVAGTVGAGVGTLVPGAHVADPLIQIATDAAAAEAQRRFDALKPDEKPGIWTTILSVVAAAGTGFLGLRSRRQTAHIDELWDATHVAAKDVPPPKA